MKFILPPPRVSGPPLGRVLMIQGTSSHAGKTTLVAAFCRLFAQAGYRVAPFKAQNMSNNAAVTETGGEVGRAQAIQARAAGVTLTVDMNPVLLKPQSDRTSQIVVLGHVRHTKDAREYYELRSELWPVVTGALDRLRATHDIVVIEGAGSPAEINLAQYDIVNMRVALYANAPVLLVGDIERGGVFAALYGTFALLTGEEQALIRGFVINKFRGDPSLLDSGFDMLHSRTNVRTLGVLPYLDLAELPEEDALDWDRLSRSQGEGSVLEIAIIRLPRVANLDEFQPLAAEPAVRVRFVASAAEVGSADLIIVPGTKSTLADLQWMRERRLDVAIRAAHELGIPVVGICGGLQILGRRIVDEEGAESAGDSVGLGLLPITTVFAHEKVTRKVSARVTCTTALWNPSEAATSGLSGSVGAQTLGAIDLDAYEIHMGRTTVDGVVDSAAPFVVHADGETLNDGFVSADGLVIGTYMHGLFENPALRRALLQGIASRKGVQLPAVSDVTTVDDTLDHLASVVRDNLDLPAVAAMIGIDAFEA